MSSPPETSSLGDDKGIRQLQAELNERNLRIKKLEETRRIQKELKQRKAKTDEDENSSQAKLTSHEEIKQRDAKTSHKDRPQKASSALNGHVQGDIKQQEGETSQDENASQTTSSAPGSRIQRETRKRDAERSGNHTRDQTVSEVTEEEEEEEEYQYPHLLTDTPYTSSRSLSRQSQGLVRREGILGEEATRIRADSSTGRKSSTPLQPHPWDSQKSKVNQRRSRRRKNHPIPQETTSPIGLEPQNSPQDYQKVNTKRPVQSVVPGRFRRSSDYSDLASKIRDTIPHTAPTLNTVFWSPVVSQTLDYLKPIIHGLNTISWKISSKVTPIIVVIFPLCVAVLVCLNILSVVYAATAKTSLAVFCELPLHQTIRSNFCLQYDEKNRAPSITHHETSVAGSFQETHQYFEQILLTSRYPKLLPHSLAAIQQAFRHLRTGVRRSNLSDNQKRVLTDAINRYIDRLGDGRHSLQVFLSGNTNTVEWIQLQKRLLVPSLKSLGNESPTTEVQVPLAITWLADRRLLWLPFGVEPFQKQHGIAARGRARLKTHIARIKPKVTIAISRATELHGIFEDLHNMEEDFKELIRQMEDEVDIKRQGVIDGRDLWYRIFTRLGFDMKDTELLKQRVDTLQATEPLMRDAGSYTSGANLTLNNIAVRLVELDERLDEGEWMDGITEESEQGEAFLNLAYWIEAGTTRLGEAQNSWNGYQKNWTDYVFS